ncbi:MAG: plasmid pRiA4b ORF-3 family protein [Desulfobacteraceae bacterium]|nr:plasmid pRiA4b ORF-3 family protein [Desulfobacteraceae bacterium]
MEITVTKKNKKSKSLYQIKVTLVGSKPPIWRRLIVKDNIRLDQLHSVLQVTMGWFDYHLHQYRVGRSYIGIPDPDFGNDVTDERKVCLQDIVFNPKDNFVYEYDFGDGWEHKIVLEKILTLDFSESPVVIKGKKSCPPEDCGGIGGYYDFLDAIQDTKHEEHESMLEWVGGEFDPDEFDMDLINEKLKGLKL